MNPRINNLTQTIIAAELDALLVTNPTNIRYLTGITSPNTQTREAILLLTHKQPIIFASPLLGSSTKALSPKLLAPTLKKYPKVGFEATNLTVAEHTQFKSFTNLIPTTNLIEDIRITKDSTEIKAITAACKLTHQTVYHLHALLKPGITEMFLSWEAEKYMRENGADGLAFPVIVASGPNSAIPHHQSSSRKLTKNDIVLIDLGARVDGYCSDMTRTFFLGTPTPEQLKIEQIVKQAHQSALRHLGSGRMDSSEVDTFTRQVINSAGFGDYFIHSTGHGLGLDIHESPSISPSSSLNPKPYTSSSLRLSEPNGLVANMVITIEPGIYLPGKFGYRHEDTVLITKNGPRVLTASY